MVNNLKKIGYEGVTSSRQMNKLADAAKIDIVDVNNELPCNIRCKYTQNMPNYFDISDDKYELLKKYIQAYNFVMQDKEEFIIRCGLGLLVDYVNNNLRLYFYNDESLKIILNFGSSLPTFELNDNSLVHCAI